ncbi:MAG: hypothetical protein PUC32_06365 [Oscillospiraceae bacterium]|nr:hypothetical protein [Oscillospiraceae bacterium]
MKPKPEVTTMIQRRFSTGQLLYFSLLCAAVLFFGAGFLCFPQQTAGGVSSGLSLCLYTLIPSTFPFVVLSSFCVYSGVSRLLGKLLQPITKLLFHLPGCCGSVILLGWLGGYPTGARGIVSLYQHGSITRQQGERMLWFCINGGPSFLISVVGMGIYGSASFGLLLFICQTGALLLIGIVSGIVSRWRKEPTLAQQNRGSPKKPFAEALVQAADDGARGALNLCSFVMLFTAMLEPLYSSGILSWIAEMLQKLSVPAPAATVLFPLCWEITSGVNFAGSVGISPALLLFFTAAGGLCVLGQITAATTPLGISKIKLLLSRLLHGGVSLLLFLPLRRFFYTPDQITSVFHSTTEPLSSAFSAGGTTPLTTGICGVTLLLLCIVFLLCKKRPGLAKIR